MSQPVTIRMAPWVLGAISLAALAFIGMASYFFFYGDSYLLRYAGTALAAFAIAAALDALASKIVLDTNTMHINSLMRRRAFQRAEFEGARVEGGAVALKRKAGGWLILPGTGQDALALRNTIDEWIKRPGA